MAGLGDPIYGFAPAQPWASADPEHFLKVPGHHWFGADQG